MNSLELCFETIATPYRIMT